MDELKNTAGEIVDHTGDLIDTYYRLFVVNATDKGSKVASIGITVIVMGLISFTALLFAGVGFAIWIGEYLQNMKAGFFLAAALFILLLCLFAAIREKVISPIIRNKIIRKLYE